MDVKTIMDISLKIDEVLLNDYIKIDKIIIYGNISDSANDIDLVFISNDFKDMYPKKRKDFVYKAVTSSKKMDLICLTSDKFIEASCAHNVFSKNIFEKGVVLYDRNRQGQE